MSQPTVRRQEIIQKYKQNIQEHESAIRKLKAEKKWIAVARLISALAGFGLGWYCWPLTFPVICVILLCVFSLTYFIFLDTDKSLAIGNLERLMLVNRHEADAMHHELSGYDNGNIFSRTRTCLCFRPGFVR